MRRVGIQPKATFIVALTALILSMAPAAAELWPQRPVRIVVPIAAGSSPDVAARVFAQHLAARWGSTVVVENRPGGDGVIGTTTFATVQASRLPESCFPLPFRPSLARSLRAVMAHLGITYALGERAEGLEPFLVWVWTGVRSARHGARYAGPNPLLPVQGCGR